MKGIRIVLECHQGPGTDVKIMGTKALKIRILCLSVPFYSALEVRRTDIIFSYSSYFCYLFAFFCIIKIDGTSGHAGNRERGRFESQEQNAFNCKDCDLVSSWMPLW